MFRVTRAGDCPKSTLPTVAVLVHGWKSHHMGTVPRWGALHSGDGPHMARIETAGFPSLTAQQFLGTVPSRAANA